MKTSLRIGGKNRTERRAAGGAGLIAALIAVAVVALLAAGCEKPSTPPARKDSPQAKLRAKLLKQHKLDGKVTLIEFGAVGCEFSGSGLDEMIMRHAAEALPGLEYLRVETSGNDAAVAKYYADKSLKFAMHRDAKRALSRAFGATATPTFVLVGTFGRVRYRGGFPDKRLSEWVETLLAETADPGQNVALFGTVQLDAGKLLVQTRLPDLSGKVQTLAGFAGPGGLLVMFVDTACPYAAAAIKDIPKISPTLAAKKIGSVLICIDDPEPQVKARFVNKALGAPLLYDATTRTKNFWNISSVPTVVFIDAAGQIGYSGKAIWADVAVAINKAAPKMYPTQFNATGTEYG